MADGFWLGPIKIYYYSLCILLAVWAGYGLLLRQTKSLKLSSTLLTDFVMTVLVTGVIGARLGYVIQNWTYYRAFPGDILKLSSGGLSIHGALVFGLLALFLLTRKKGLRFLAVTDAFAPPVLLGQIIGRFGNYFNQELYGYPTNLPWKIFIDDIHRVPAYQNVAYYHPTFLYEIILNSLGLLLIWRWQRGHKKTGQLTGLYLIVLGLSRFITEIWRISDRLAFHLSLAQYVSVFLIIAGAALYFKQDHTS